LDLAPLLAELGTQVADGGGQVAVVASASRHE
jgi:hypothetical protein